MLQCFVCSPIPKVSEKNGQPVRVSFGKKLLRIGTLVAKDLLSNLYTVSSESMHPWKMTISSLMDGVAKNWSPFPVSIEAKPVPTSNDRLVLLFTFPPRF